MALALAEQERADEDNEREVARALAEEGFKEKQRQPKAAIALADERPEPEVKAPKMSKLASVQLLQNMIRGRRRLLVLEAQEPKEPEPAPKTGRFGSLKELLASKGG